MGVKVREKVKGSKVYWLFIDHNGKRKAKRVGDKKAAELAAIKIQAKLAEGDASVFSPAAAPVPTFKQYADRWLDGIAGLGCQASTLDQYRRRLETRIIPHFGPLPLTAITRERVKALAAAEFRAGSCIRKGRPISPKTVEDFMTTLVSVLNSAVDDGLIPSNPATRWGKVIRRDKAEVEEIEVFTPDELAGLLSIAERDDPAHYPFLLCLARTGMRLGEAMALRWEDVDWANRVILVRRSTRRGQTKVTKNGKARRLDMSQQLGDVLRGWKSLQEAEAAVEGRELPLAIFPTMATDVRAQDTFRRVVWAPLLRRAELRYRKPHTLRHTFASILIQTGDPGVITYVQNQLGHHSAAFTLTVYGHFIPRAGYRVVDRLDDATNRNPGATSETAIPVLAGK